MSAPAALAAPDAYSPSASISGTTPTLVSGKGIQSSTITINLTATDVDDSGPWSFSCSLDGGAFTGCGTNSPTGTVTYNGLSEGWHTFKYYATDPSGSPATPARVAAATKTQGFGVELSAVAIGVSNRQHFALDSVVNACTTSSPQPGTPGLYSNGVATCTVNGNPQSSGALDTSTLGSHYISSISANDVFSSGPASSGPLAYEVDPPTYSSTVTRDNPTAYWRMSEPVSSATWAPAVLDPSGEPVMKDSSGNGHDGTYKNHVLLNWPGSSNCGIPATAFFRDNGYEGVTPASSGCNLGPGNADPKYGGAPVDELSRSAYFTGNSPHGYAPPYGIAGSIPGPPTSNTAVGYTLEAWVYPRSEPDGSIHDSTFLDQDSLGALYISHDGSGNPQFGYSHFANNDPNLDLTSGSPINGAGTGSSGPVAVTPNQWHHVVGTWKVVTLTSPPYARAPMTLYVDGVAVSNRDTLMTTQPDTGSDPGAPQSTNLSATSNQPTNVMVGNGHRISWPFHGKQDESATYPTALSAREIGVHWAVGSYLNNSAHRNYPSVSQADATSSLDTTYPTVDSITTGDSKSFPDGATWTPDKMGAAWGNTTAPGGPVNFSCSDPDVNDVPTCTGAYDNNAPAAGPLAKPVLMGVGPHKITITAADRAGNVRQLVRHFTIVDPNQGSVFAQVVQSDNPGNYYRLNDADRSTVMADLAGNQDGSYVNCYGPDYRTDLCHQRGGPVGPSAENASSRLFLGYGGYGYANNLYVPTSAYTIEAWVHPDDTGDMSIVQHGGGGVLWIAGGRFWFRPEATEPNLSSDTVNNINANANGNQANCGAPGWYHVVGTWDGRDARFYVNGVRQGSPALDDARAAAAGTAGTFYVGYGDQAPWTRGDLAEVAQYPTALSDERVAEHCLADPAAAAPARHAPTAVDIAAAQAARKGTTGSTSTTAPATTAPATTAKLPAPRVPGVFPKPKPKVKPAAAKPKVKPKAHKKAKRKKRHRGRARRARRH
ncbi:MAG TPA: LamG domain-containing protein [Solirubrobacteraceae bacterium]|nr:LamG domain-containing protein [Solirubrobacteraceae bacterium]